MITVAPLQAEDRESWEELFAGYDAFYGRTWPAERYDQAWDEFRRDVRIHALGARLDGRLVGIAHFLVHASTTASRHVRGPVDNCASAGRSTHVRAWTIFPVHRIRPTSR